MRIAPAPNHFMLTDLDRFAYIWPIHRGKPVCQYPGLPLFRGILVMLRRFGLVCLFVSIATLPVRAESVRITQDIEARTIMLNGAAIVIDRTARTGLRASLPAPRAPARRSASHR